MRTHLSEKVRGTNLRDVKSGGGHVPRIIYAPGFGEHLFVHPSIVIYVLPPQ